MTATRSDASTTARLDASDLGQVSLFASLDPAGLDRVAAAGQRRLLADKEVLFREGDAATHFYVVLSGELVVTLAGDGGERVLARYAAGRGEPDDAGAYSGEFSGEMPLLTDTAHVTGGRAEGDTELAVWDRQAFGDVILGSPETCRELLPMLARRIRYVEEQTAHKSTLAGLETLVAGLAHELNNPVSAVSGAMGELAGCLGEVADAAIAWGGTARPDERIHVDAVAERVSPPSEPLPALEASERSDALQTWFADHDLEDGGLLSETLAEQGTTVEHLDEVAAGLRPEALAPAVTHFARQLDVRALTRASEAAAGRIAALVDDARGYADLDRAPHRDVDVTEGIDATLAVLRPQLGDIEVVRRYEPDLPRVDAYPAELNQVWAHLFRNAATAMAGSGVLTVAVTRDGGEVAVEVQDTGCGIPPDARPRLFFPFFTTEVGAGPGLGLSLVHRLVTGHHEGSVDVRSRPGETCFTVRLPVERADDRTPAGS